MSTIRVALVEDQRAEIDKYVRELTSDGRVAVKAFWHPDSPKSIANHYDLFLVDLELTKELMGRQAWAQVGTSFVADLKGSHRDYPVVLITRKSRLREFSDIPDLERAADDIVLKDDIDRNGPEEAIVRLVTFAEDFRILREAPKRDWETLMMLLGADQANSDRLRLAAPPLPDAHTKIQPASAVSLWIVSEVARWITHVLMTLPGILYDSLHASTSLGLAEQEFLSPEVQKLFRRSRYSGAFGRLGSRWWRDRLHAQAFQLVGADRKEPLYVVFADALSKVIGREVRRSKCIYSGKSPADQVCYVLQAPVLLEYTLPYYPDDRPAVMDEARVSFKAIRETNKVNYDLFDASSRERAEAIREKAGEI